MSNAADTHDAPARCENCDAPLQGEFCHRCGQSSHNPLRHAGHAIEEVFESFWHLDGRIFRTLRSLWSPGRLANAYLAGHRAPYVAPLRLFVILSVLTFFIAQYAVSFGNPGRVELQGIPELNDAIDQAATVDEVLKQRDDAVRSLAEVRDTLPVTMVGAREKIELNIAAIQKQARDRIARLDPAAPALKVPDTLPAASAQPTDLGSLFQVDGKPWHPVDNPVKVAGLPDFANHWLNKKLARAKENIPRLQKDPELFKHAFMSAVPTTLFFLVPLFAVLLKLAYLGTRRLYLEHLVVALYSHAWLCLAILALCLLIGLDSWISPHARWFRAVTDIAEAGIGIWMPIYLLLMQRRVYRQSWWITVPKYLVLGTLYLMLVICATLFLTITSFVNM